MPRYDYECMECGKEFEVWHGMEEKCEKCESCESKKIQKKPFLNSFSEQSNKGKVVEEHIKDNEQILKKMRRERMKEHKK